MDTRRVTTEEQQQLLDEAQKRPGVREVLEVYRAAAAQTQMPRWPTNLVRAATGTNS